MGGKGGDAFGAVIFPLYAQVGIAITLMSRTGDVLGDTYSVAFATCKLSLSEMQIVAMSNANCVSPDFIARYAMVIN